MKLQRRYKLISIVTIVVLLLGGPLLLLSFNAPVRMLALSAVKGLYEVQRRYVLERYLIEPDFAIIAEKLSGQIDILQAFGSTHPRLSAEFIETVSLVMANARFKEDFVQLYPVLERLAALEPRSYLPQLWRAQAALESAKPNAQELIEAAISLMPADDRGYRLALRLASQQSDTGEISRVCIRWNKAQFGGLKLPKHYAKKGGLSQRRMVFQGRTNAGRLVIASNFGIELGSRRRYEFRFKEEVLANEFVLRMSLFPGTRFSVHSLELLEPQGWRKIADGFVDLLPSRGFFDRAGGLMLGHRGDQTVIFRMPDRDFGKGNPDARTMGIMLEATFERLPLSLNPACSG